MQISSIAVNFVVEDFQTQLEKYPPTTIIEKVRLYLSKTSPDFLQSVAVYAIKELYLSCAGIDLESYNSPKYFRNYAIDNSGLAVIDGCRRRTF